MSACEGGGLSSYVNNKKFEGKCYNCGEKGHMARACRSKKKPMESNVVISNSEEDWHKKALFLIKEEGMVESQGVATEGKKGVLKESSKDVAL
ncbi:hypothetical protein PVK06_016984 [Gossypium arboreum]|uniref:CCHC-type domain-containing protein n=1 Tax=Gossypium arboreum TaxID=29729 RepID=A0ABR0Q1J0_GOSAR|nr:hypothetical protein PVK06_016984 [Gossypium arboreum]